MKRALMISISLAACAPHFDQRAHLGADGEVWGARMLHFDQGIATARGVVTARGGDSVDWVAFDVPDDLGCHKQELEVSLQWKAPRGRSKLALTLYDQTRAHPVDAHRRGQRADVRLDSTPPGHYFARISTRGPDDAGTYLMEVRHDLGMNCELPTEPSFAFTRPAGYPSPSFPPRMDRAVADVYRIEIDWHAMKGEAFLGPAAGVAIGQRGMFVDAHGGAIRYGGFDVVDASRAGAIVALDQPAKLLDMLDRGAEPWTAAIELPPPPVDAALLTVTPDHDGNVMLRFDRGSADGVLPGSVGELVHASGVRVPGARFVIVGVGEHESTGMGAFVITDPDHLRAVIGTPPKGTPP